MLSVLVDLLVECLLLFVNVSYAEVGAEPVDLVDLLLAKTALTVTRDVVIVLGHGAADHFFGFWF